MKKKVSIALAVMAVIAIAVMLVVTTSNVPANPDLLQSSGKLTLLRVHDVGTGYGPPGDQLDVEVIIKLDSQPGKSFGYQLRNDNNHPARQGMLDILRDAFNHNWTVTINYHIDAGKNNGVIMRTWLTK